MWPEEEIGSSSAGPCSTPERERSPEAPPRSSAISAASLELRSAGELIRPGQPEARAARAASARATSQRHDDHRDDRVVDVRRGGASTAVQLLADGLAEQRQTRDPDDRADRRHRRRTASTASSRCRPRRAAPSGTPGCSAIRRRPASRSGRTSRCARSILASSMCSGRRGARAPRAVRSSRSRRRCSRRARSPSTPAMMIPISVRWPRVDVEAGEQHRHLGPGHDDQLGHR